MNDIADSKDELDEKLENNLNISIRKKRISNRLGLTNVVRKSLRFENINNNNITNNNNSEEMK